jgi:regulator of sirC expression with transglutaminase-like and TPR domain
MRFLNPVSKEQISQEQIKDVLKRTLSALTPEEFDPLKKMVNTNAFAKIADNLDILTGLVLSIIKE